MRRYIHELSTVELGKVFDSNDTLKEMVLTDLVETMKSFHEEVMYSFEESLIDCEISGFESTRIEVDRGLIQSFIDGAKKSQDRFTFLDVEKEENLMELEGAYNSLNDTSFEDRHSDKLEREVDELIAVVESDYQEVMESAYATLYEDDTQKEHFVSFYANEKLSENCFIEDGTYNLYEQVVYDYHTGSSSSFEKEVVSKKYEKSQEGIER